MLLNRSGSYRKCKDRDRPLLLANSRSNLWVIVLGWQKLENPKLFEFSDPTDPCPFLSFFFFSFFFSLSLHFFYFGDQPWHPHPHRRLIFNYGAADSRTRNTFIAAPGIDFQHGSTETYPQPSDRAPIVPCFVDPSRKRNSLRSFSPREFIYPNILKLLCDFVKI